MTQKLNICFRLEGQLITYKINKSVYIRKDGKSVMDGQNKSKRTELTDLVTIFHLYIFILCLRVTTDTYTKEHKLFF